MSDFDQFQSLLSRLTAAFVTLEEHQLRALFRHFELLRAWNRVMNLTKVDSLEEAVERHYAESLFLASRLPSTVKRIADIGSGAGFPGFPVAVAFPECEVVLVESDQRKAAFLRESRDSAPNVKVMAIRAQAVPVGFDMVLARAVKPSEVVKVARRISGSVALLISEEDAATLSLPGAVSVPLPFRRGGVLYLADVSRGTCPRGRVRVSIVVSIPSPRTLQNGPSHRHR